MAAYKIKTFSHAIEDIAGVINMRGKLTPRDREMLRERMWDIRSFLAACEMNRDEIELALACNNRRARN